jgi:hypothetical protein
MITFYQFISFILLLALSATTQAASLIVRNEDNPTQQKELVFISQPPYTPFEFIHKTRATHINGESAQNMAAELGFKIRIITVPKKNAVKMLRTGETKAMTRLFYSPQREFDVSCTLKKTPEALYARGGQERICSRLSLNDYHSKPMSRQALIDLINKYMT